MTYKEIQKQIMFNKCMQSLAEDNYSALIDKEIALRIELKSIDSIVELCRTGK